MSSEASKTEKPTPKKLKDARKEGNVAYSHDLSMFVGISVVVLGLIFGRNYITDSLAKNYFFVFKLINTTEFDKNTLYAATMQMMSNMTSCMLPLIIASAAAVMITTVIQLGGFVIKEDIFKFDMQTFNIVQNAKQMFSKKNLAKFFFNILKLIIMAVVSYWLVVNSLNQILLIVTVPLYDMLAVASVIILKIVLTLLGAYFIFGLIDLVVEKRAIYKKLMMSLEEIKDEMKETEGNQEVKQRLRELRQELLADDNSMFAQYKDSMLVLANPTHIAILIIYLPQRWGLPIVIFKAKGALAQHIFRLAKKYQVPIIREKLLARRLYEVAILNQFVPTSLIKDVAEVIAKNLNLMPKIAREIELMKKSPPPMPMVPVVPKPGSSMFNVAKRS